MLSDISGVYLVVVLVTILISLGVHEAMHGFVAHWLGDDTAHREGRLTLNPLVHIDFFTTILLPMVLILAHLPPILAAKPVPFNPDRLRFDEFGAALVGLAGPLTNLVLAAVVAVILRTFGADLSGFLYNSILIFTEINVGSRVLYAFAPEPLREVMRQIEAAGFMLLLVVFLLAFQFISGPIIQIQQTILRFLLV
jgi:Zn-dependent protease